MEANIKALLPIISLPPGVIWLNVTFEVVDKSCGSEIVVVCEGLTFPNKSVLLGLIINPSPSIKTNGSLNLKPIISP